jgi:hypothetical protein
MWTLVGCLNFKAMPAHRFSSLGYRTYWKENEKFRSTFRSAVGNRKHDYPQD